MVQARDGRATVVVYDATGEIYEALRGSTNELTLRRGDGEPLDLRSHRPDLLVLAAYDSTDWAAAVRLVDTGPTVIVSTRFDDARASRALSLGLTGYLDATLPPATLERALLAAVDGEPAYPRMLLGQWIRWQLASLRALGRPTLTPRQAEVLALVARGAADKEIAGVLGISTATAQKHVANIRKRLGVPNRAAAAALLPSKEVSA